MIKKFTNFNESKKYVDLISNFCKNSDLLKNNEYKTNSEKLNLIVSDNKNYYEIEITTLYRADYKFNWHEISKDFIELFKSINDNFGLCWVATPKKYNYLAVFGYINNKGSVLTEAYTYDDIINDKVSNSPNVDNFHSIMLMVSNNSNS